MSKDKKPNEGGSVTPLQSFCVVPKCGKKSHKSTFCQEHFTWFKEGLINRQGERPTDFDKKYQDFLRRNKNAA